MVKQQRIKSYSTKFFGLTLFLIFSSKLYPQQIMSRVYNDSGNVQNYEIIKIENGDSIQLIQSSLFLYSDFTSYLNDSSDIRCYYDIDKNIQLIIDFNKISGESIIPLGTITLNQFDFQCLVDTPVFIKNNYLLIETGSTPTKINLENSIEIETIKLTLINALCKE